MADEVVVSERSYPGYVAKGTSAIIQGLRLTTQVRDIGVQSAAFGTNTNYIRLTANGAAFWYKIGENPSAAANTDGNEFLPSGATVEEPVAPGEKIATAADA